jgi:hypothetical protein
MDAMDIMDEMDIMDLKRERCDRVSPNSVF